MAEEFKIGDLLVCWSGEEQETATLGYIVDVTNESKRRYVVQWFDDPDGETWDYLEDTIHSYRKLLNSECNENQI